MYRIREWNHIYDEQFRDSYSPGWIYIYSTKWWIKAHLKCLWYNYSKTCKHEVDKCES